MPDALARTPRDSRSNAASGDVPLSTLLSWALVAFTIEFDNEWEHRLAEPPRPRLWLTSLVMWANFMRFVPDGGIPVHDLRVRSGVPAEVLRSRLSALKRWGYVAVGGPSPREWRIRPTPGGRRAQEVWRPLGAAIEDRWRERFGQGEIAALRAALERVTAKLDLELPHYLPVLGYGFFPTVQEFPPRAPAPPGASERPALDLATLFSQVLLTFTLDFEAESALSLAISANVLRILNADGVAVRDLPRLSGVSKEAIAMALGFLEKRGLITIGSDPDARTKSVQLPPAGQRAQVAYRRCLVNAEKRLQERFGSESIRQLRASLHALTERRDAEGPVLSRGLHPYPGGWRARKPYLTQTLAVLRDPAASLPHYPMVLHRGGFPDGS